MSHTKSFGKTSDVTFNTLCKKGTSIMDSKGNTNIPGALTVRKNAELKKNLTVCGDVIIKGNISASNFNNNVGSNIYPIIGSNLLNSVITTPVSANTCPNITIPYIAQESIPEGRLVTAGSGFRVILAQGPNKGVIGVSTNSAEIGETVHVCVTGIFKVQLDSETNNDVGFPIGVSSEDGDGYAYAGSPPPINRFGIALEQGGPGDLIKGTFVKNFDFQDL